MEKHRNGMEDMQPNSAPSHEGSSESRETMQTPMLRRAVTGSLEDSKDHESFHVLNALIQMPASRDAAYLSIIQFAKADLRLESPVLKRAVNLLSQFIPNHTPSEPILAEVGAFTQEIRLACSYAHAADHADTSGVAWLDKQALVLGCSVSNRLTNATHKLSQEQKRRKASPEKGDGRWPEGAPEYPPLDAVKRWRESSDSAKAGDFTIESEASVSSTRLGDQECASLKGTLKEAVEWARVGDATRIPTGDELTSARTRRNRSEVASRTEKPRGTEPSKAIEGVEMKEKDIGALVEAALLGQDGWGFDSEATCAAASELTSSMADAMTWDDEDEAQTVLVYLLDRFLSKNEESVRARAYDLLASAGMRVPERRGSVVRSVLFPLAERTVTQQEPSEKVWLAVLNCLCLFCTREGELDIQRLKSLSPRVLLNVLSVSGQFAWPLHVQSHFASALAHYVGTSVSQLLADAGSAAIALRTYAIVSEPHARRILMAFIASLLSEHGCLPLSSRLASLLAPSSSYDATLLALGIPHAVDELENVHGVPRQEAVSAVSVMASLHGARDFQRRELEVAVASHTRRLNLPWLVRAMTVSTSACDGVLRNGLLLLVGRSEGIALHFAVEGAIGHKLGMKESERVQRLCNLCEWVLPRLRSTGAYWFAVNCSIAMLRAAVGSNETACALLREPGDMSKAREEVSGGLELVSEETLRLLSATIRKGKEGILVGRKPGNALKALAILRLPGGTS